MSAAARAARRADALCCALLALSVPLMLWRTLPPGRSPVGVDSLYANPRYVPFSEVRPDGYEPHNPYLSDVVLGIDPFARHLRRTIREGHFPWWCPDSGGGVPFVGNFSTAVFFPTNWLHYLPEGWLSVGRALFWGSVLRLLAAVLFGYLLLRRLRLAPPAAAGGALALGFFGHQIVWLYYQLSNVGCLIPFCLWLTDRYARRPSRGRFAALSFGLALQSLGGHAETSVALVALCALWFTARSRRGEPLGRRLGRFVSAGAIGIGLAGFQLFPFLEYLALSQQRYERAFAARPSPETALDPLGAPGLALGLIALVLAALGLRWLRRPSWSSALRAGAALGAALALLVPLGLDARPLLLLDPDLWGSPFAEGYRGPEAYTDLNAGYVGALVLLGALAAASGGARRHGRLVAALGGGAAVVLLLFARAEPLFTLFHALPGMRLVAPARLLPVAAVGLAVLAALYLDAARRRTPSGAAVRALGRGGLSVAVAGSVLAAAVRLSPEPGLPKREEGTIRWIEPASGSQALRPETGRGRPARLVVRFVVEAPACREVVVEVGGAPVGSAPVDPVSGRATVTWDASRADAGFYVCRARGEAGGTVATAPPLGLRIERPAVVRAAALARAAGAAALLAVAAATGGGGLVGAAAVWIFGELFVWGSRYNASVPEAWVYPETRVTRTLRADIERRRRLGEGPWRVMGEDVILQPNMHLAYGLHHPRVYDMLEVRRYDRFLLEVLEPGTPFTRWNRDTVRFDSPLFEILNVGYLVTAEPLEREGFTELLRSPHGCVYRFERALPRAFLASRAVDLLRTPPERLRAFDPRDTAFLEGPPPAPLGGRGSVRFVRYEPNVVELEVDADAPAILVLTDNFFPGWRVFVDGEPKPLLRSHFTFKAVLVPSGRSRVRFEYVPRAALLGAASAALALLLLVLPGGRRRPRPAS